MTAMAPQPQRPRQSAAVTQSQPDGNVPAEAAQRQGQAQAQAAQRKGQAAQARAQGVRQLAARRSIASSTPRQLRIARGVAATACLLPGLVGMVEIASAATAPVSSPTQTYADLRAGASTYLARAASTAVAGQPGDQRTSLDLARVQNQVGTAALLYPDRSSDLYRVSDELGKRQAQLAGLAKGQGAANAAVPAPAGTLTDALVPLENPPAARSVVNRQHVVIAGAVGLVGLLGASIWLARKTKRVVNPGLLAGALVTAGVSALGYMALTTSSAVASVDEIAQVRANAAQSVAAEAESLSSATVDGAAAQAKAKGYVDAGTDLVSGNAATWGRGATGEWTAFATKELTANQLSSGSVADRQKLIAGRLADLDALTGRLATLGQEYGAGSDRRPNAWAGYGVFALSLLAGAAAWTGVGRRVAEYR